MGQKKILSNWVSELYLTNLITLISDMKIKVKTVRKSVHTLLLCLIVSLIPVWKTTSLKTTIQKIWFNKKLPINFKMKNNWSFFPTSRMHYNCISLQFFECPSLFSISKSSAMIRCKWKKWNNFLTWFQNFHQNLLLKLAFLWSWKFQWKCCRQILNPSFVTSCLDQLTSVLQHYEPFFKTRINSSAISTSTYYHFYDEI